MDPLSGFAANLATQIITPLQTLLVAAASVYFMYGLAIFILNFNNVDERNKGKKHMIWGLIGLFVVFFALQILGILLNTFGLGTIS